MPLGAIIEGERRLLGVLGANVTLGGVRVVAEKAHNQIADLMPLCSDLLVLVQVAVGIATLVYMIIKIRKITKK
jgi:hypothetical protein